MILAAGDSFTWGEELEDRLAQAWPYLLGRRLNLAVDNLAKSGCSNDTILRSTLDRISQQAYDLVLVGWTTPYRFEVWSEILQHPITIMPASQAGLPWIEDYFKYSYNMPFELRRWAQQIILLQQYLKSRGQPYLFINIAGLHVLEPELQHLWSQIDTDCYVGWHTHGMIEIAADAERGPGGHPLTLGHQRIADEIAKYIRN